MIKSIGNFIQNKKSSPSNSEGVEFLAFLNASSWRFKSIYSESYFDWKIQSNPFGKSFCYLRFVSKNAVAHASITAKPINENLNLGFECAEMGDTHTHPTFQKQGHFSGIVSEVINEYNNLFNDKAVIFGTPNENSVHGYQSRCNCEIVHNFNIVEHMTVGWAFSLKNRDFSLRKFKDEEHILETMNNLWVESYKNQLCLIKKKSDWIKWRYLQCPERYEFFFLSPKTSTKCLAIIIVKTSRIGIFTHIDICDIIGIDSKAEITLADLFCKKFSSLFARIRVWSKKGTALDSYFLKKKIKKSKEKYFIFNKNESIVKIKGKAAFIEVSLGDTDNV